MCVGKIDSEPAIMTATKQHPAGKMRKPKNLNNLIAKRAAEKKMEMVDEGGRIQYQEDILAVSTYYTKIVLFFIGDLIQKFQKSNFYKVLFHTTQPAHIITAIAVIGLSFLVVPTENRTTLSSPIWTLIYLGSFSAHFGAQLWMTFISGLALYFALPRHHFGKVQQVLFPKYFFLNSILSLITLGIFVRGHNARLLKSTDVTLQTVAMTVCFLAELVIRLYLTPPLLKLMTIKNGMEREFGVGMEVGKLVAGDLLKCPHYVKIHKAFRKVHMIIAIGNIIAMSCTMFHLYYLSHKLCVF